MLKKKTDSPIIEIGHFQLFKFVASTSKIWKQKIVVTRARDWYGPTIIGISIGKTHYQFRWNRF